MPDITKCTGVDCKGKEECLRYTSMPNLYHQAWFNEPPHYREFGEQTCDYYLPDPMWFDEAELDD